jgi:adenine deaminase
MPEVRGTILDVMNRRFYNAAVFVKDGRIEKIEETDDVPRQFIMPGFVDAHIHIESSMMVPSEFARLAVRHPGR